MGGQAKFLLQWTPTLPTDSTRRPPYVGPRQESIGNSAHFGAALAGNGDFSRLNPFEAP